MKYIINLTGTKDVSSFHETVKNLDGQIELVSDNGRYKVNAKSYLGCLMASSEWSKIWVQTAPDLDYYTELEPWIETAADDGAYIHN